MRKAKIDAIRDALIHHFLPCGITVDQEDEEEGIVLTDDQSLKIYQGMCNLAGKRVFDNIDDCLLELKRRPYVNIMDFVNTFRTGKHVDTWDNWYDFVDYTKNGNAIDVSYAKQNEFLAPLLQNMRGPGCSVDPRKIREDFVAKREERMRARQRIMPPVKREPLDAIPEVSLSPPASDFSPSPSRSPTPEFDSFPEQDDSIPAFDTSATRSSSQPPPSEPMSPSSPSPSRSPTPEFDYLSELDDPQLEFDTTAIPSSSQTPPSDPLTPISGHGTSEHDQPHIKLELSSPDMSPSPTPPPKAAQNPHVREDPCSSMPASGVQTRASLKRACATQPDPELPGTQTTKRRKTRAQPGRHGSDIRSFFRDA